MSNVEWRTGGGGIIPAFLAAFFAMCHLSFVIPAVYAAGIEASPALLDWEGERRDEFRQTIRITNRTGIAYKVWPTAADLDPGTGTLSIPDGPGAGHERMSTWAEMPRGDIFLKPGETEEVPVMFKVSTHAGEGTYHGAVLFAVGETMEQAYARAAESARVPVTIRVRTDVRERLNVLRFVPSRSVFFGLPTAFTLTVGNGGNIGTPVRGSVRIFNRHDEEVAVLDAGDGDPLGVGDEADYDIRWIGRGGFGHYKAFLELPYAQKALVTDTAFFWVVPVWFIAVLVAVAVLGSVLAARFIHRRSGSSER